jgi:hypothetical protein
MGGFASKQPDTQVGPNARKRTKNDQNITPAVHQIASGREKAASTSLVVLGTAGVGKNTFFLLLSLLLT